jgi:hypothetical protein
MISICCSAAIRMLLLYLQPSFLLSAHLDTPALAALA